MLKKLADFRFQADAFRGHGLSRRASSPVGSSAHAIPAGVAAFHYNH